ncbi:MAG TPA: hypothetical protein DEG06_05065 [Lachnospiraceae bacterium]|jgi:hypothetical protein|nr:hypothetical protein [Lachnospiraceae bacterium]HBY71594.1 hypothetical protein [Lachnospiraceae bacterium]HCA69295.1 hypothetical protein [Lachnospiraceae bacterium]HCM12096.1 hypothetical protein [Lachnospiraceae bacterium]HCR41133.1 hypothetical protein [Lachnospiraceae bacterium]
MKKALICITLICSMLLCSTSANAKQSTKISDIVSLHSENALFSDLAYNIDAEVINFIKKSGVNITDSSLIELIPIDDQKSLQANRTNDSTNILCVKNIIGNIIECTYITSFEYNSIGQLSIASYPEIFTSSANGSSTGETFPWPDYYPITVTGGIYYELFQDDFGYPYYRPIDCSVRIASIDSDVSCSYINGTYSCIGKLVDPTTFTQLGNETYTHVISAHASMPQLYYSYFGNNPLVGKAIDCFGDIDAGYSYNIVFTCNGELYSYTPIK